MLLAQISDFHVGKLGSSIDTEYRTSEHLRRAVEHINRLAPRPDVVLCTGDLVDEGSTEEYARLVALLAELTMPFYVVPGNHDHRENLRAAFGGRGYLPAEGFLQYTVDLGELRLIALDTHVPGAPGGLLCAERLAWLDARLGEEPQRATVVMQHHPPFRSGISYIDTMGLEGIEGFTEVVARHPQVERVLCGHLHRPIVRRVAGTVAMTCPSTSHQLELDLREPGRLALVDEPPVCLLHVFREGLGLITHSSYMRDFGAPHVLVEV
ncbi:phosphodiesterase [Pendulispora albinea]|uniref:Phosphodiesterase n=1 Tax=Pendulispora albinea TaxID=2741071 RepID=A0ABZ2LZP6_9BACT